MNHSITSYTTHVHYFKGKLFLGIQTLQFVLQKFAAILLLISRLLWKTGYMDNYKDKQEIGRLWTEHVQKGLA
jgi:hypothetical protein